MSTAEPTVNKQLVTGACPRCSGKLHPFVADSAYLADKCTACGGAWWHQTPLPLDAAEVIALGHAKRTEGSAIARNSTHYRDALLLRLRLGARDDEPRRASYKHPREVVPAAHGGLVIFGPNGVETHFRRVPQEEPKS